MCKLVADKLYTVSIDGQIFKTLKTDKKGGLDFEANTKAGTSEISIRLLNK
jgi:hypothetical protein